VTATSKPEVLKPKPIAGSKAASASTNFPMIDFYEILLAQQHDD
jgi:hypothetical protein